MPALGNKNWTDYWDDESTIYVSPRHKQVHYETIARDFLSCLRVRGARVVDYGCGEALFAHSVADACSHLYLCDSAPSVRQHLAERYAGRTDITVISPQEFATLPDATIDLVVVNSVVQYLSWAQFSDLLSLCRDKLRPNGRLVLADLIPRDVGPLRDTIEFLKFAGSNGFLLSAFAGLARSFFSDYRRLRAKVGLLRMDERQAIDALSQVGFTTHRYRRNFGHNTRRITLMARRRSDQSQSAPETSRLTA